MPARMTGAVFTYQTHMLYVGPLISSARHKHHAGQVMWVPGGLAAYDASGAPHQVSLHLVPPDTFHHHEAAVSAAVLWVDRDDLLWDRGPDLGAQQMFPCSLPAPDTLTNEAARGLARGLLELVAPADRAHGFVPLHPAVKRMCALLDSAASEREISITELAKQSGLSTRQLRHRFTEELGINPSAYLRWRRLRRALTAIQDGASLTQAAMAGGFADGAHFSRVFQAQFGMSPSQAASSVRFGGALPD
jgi:AraC-like DNA-binding protein